MARPSTIKTHKSREEIERAIAEGVPATEISRRFNVSPSAVSRHKSNRNDALALALADDTPAPSDVLARVADLADSANRSRKLADTSGSVAVRARAQSTELATLNVLIDRLGVDDLDTARLAEGAGTLVRAIRSVALNHPETGRYILAALREHEALEPLADGLAKLLEKK